MVIPIILFGLCSSDVSAEQKLRVATLTPAVNDGLRSDPDRYELVATVRTSMHAPAQTSVFDLGSPHSPNIEQLAASQPDLVIGDKALHARLASQLKPLGVEVVMVDASSSLSLLEGLSEIANRVPHSRILSSRVDEAQSELSEISLSNPVSVVALFGVPGSFYLVSERWWLGSMLKGLGFTNLVPDVPNKRYPGLVPVNDERLAMLRPDIVFLISHGDPEKIKSEFARMTAEEGAWAQIGSASRGVHVLDPEVFMMTPALNAPEVAQTLVQMTDSEGAL